MGDATHERVSKFLSYVLRHHPESIDLNVDDRGWAAIADLTKNGLKHGYDIKKSLIHEIIRSGGKQRFILSDDEKYIRAGYGHSIDVDLQLRPKKPPKMLYHGTAEQHVPSILEEGIRPGSRNFVHLSAEVQDAREVGTRHGSPVVLRIESQKMFHGEHVFFQSESETGIWLTQKVPPIFVVEPEV